ncbi:MAG: flagellar motor protein MotB, partial [Acidobacteriota bacterium]
MGPGHEVVVVGRRGGHGGAWKVAFADFMTAMMAFFLVLWLMGSDEE